MLQWKRPEWDKIPYTGPIAFPRTHVLSIRVPSRYIWECSVCGKVDHFTESWWSCGTLDETRALVCSDACRLLWPDPMKWGKCNALGYTDKDCQVHIYGQEATP